MLDNLGIRVERIATKVTKHGAACVEGGVVGFAIKTKQIDRFVRPTDAAATEIAIGERFVLVVGGEHELPIATGFAPSGTVAGDKLFIDPDDNAVKRTSIAAGDLPLGVVVEKDTAPDPDRVLVNTNAWQAFLPTPS